MLLEDGGVDFVFLCVDECSQFIKGRFVGVDRIFLPMREWEGMVHITFLNTLVYSAAHDDFCGCVFFE